MHRQHGTRRMVLAALVVVAVVHAGSDSASATAHKRPDFGSAEGFRLECELLGGTHGKDRIGNTNCHDPDGTWTQCDATATTAGSLRRRDRDCLPQRWTRITSLSVE